MSNKVYECKHCGGFFGDLHDCAATIKTPYVTRCGVSGCNHGNVSGSSFCTKHQPCIESSGVDFDGDTVLVEVPDMVNHPPHYNTGKFEVIDMLEDILGKEGFEKYCIGNSLKYLMRYEHKGNALQDLEKAAWYLNKAIEKRKG